MDIGTNIFNKKFLYTNMKVKIIVNMKEKIKTIVVIKSYNIVHF